MPLRPYKTSDQYPLKLLPKWFESSRPVFYYFSKVNWIFVIFWWCCHFFESKIYLRPYNFLRILQFILKNRFLSTKIWWVKTLSLLQSLSSWTNSFPGFPHLFISTAQFDQAGQSLLIRIADPDQGLNFWKFNRFTLWFKLPLYFKPWECKYIPTH